MFDPGPRDPHLPVRVFVVALGAAMRAGLAALVEHEPDLVVVGAGAFLPDDASADVLLAEMRDGLEDLPGVLPTVTLGAPGSGANDRCHLAHAWLALDAPAAQVAAAIRAVAAGLDAWPAAASPAFRPASAAPAREDDQEPERLTAREREVLDLVALGLPNKGIALRLGISEHTAKFHVGAVLAKLGAASRAEAVAIAIRRGILAL